MVYLCYIVFTHRIVFLPKGARSETVQKCRSEAEALLALAGFDAYRSDGDNYFVEAIDPPEEEPTSASPPSDAGDPS